MAVLAERCGLSVPTVSKMLDEGEGSLDTFLRITQALSCFRISSMPLTS